MVEVEIAGTVELLPPHVEEDLSVRVLLEDTSMIDAPSQTVAEALCKLNSPAKRTAAFTMVVDDAVLNPRHDYVLSARAEQLGQTKKALYGTVQSYPWSTSDNRPRRLELKKLN